MIGPTRRWVYFSTAAGVGRHDNSPDAAHEGDRHRQIEALFDAFVENTCFASSRGCALANAAVDIAESDHPGRKVAVKSKTEMRRRFRDLAAKVGAAKADI
jgi:hypothetical protein